MAEAPARGHSLLMLVPHEPTLDPRVHYTATSLAKQYDVTVLAVIRDFERRPEENYPQLPAYATERVPLQSRGTLRMVADFCGLLVEQKLGRPNAAAAAMLTCALVGGAAALALPAALARTTRAGIAAFWPLSGPAARGGLAATLSSFRFIFRANATLLQRIRSRCLAADYVYCHDLYALQAAVMLRHESGCRLIYDSHEFYPYLERGRLFQLLTRLYEGVLVRFVDSYITVSPLLASALEGTYGRSGIVAIPNVEPLPTELAPPAAGELSTLAAGRLKLLYQGSFAEGRGLEEVLREWRQVDGTRAALFLRGPANRWRDRLEAMARDGGYLGKSIYFLPPVLERDLIGAAREADAGLIPYKSASRAYRFACPNKLSQYLHAGLAIVTNSIPFVRAMVDEQGIGVCYDSDAVGDFARAVNRLAHDPAELALLRRRATATGRDVYRWENYEDKLLASVEAA